MKGTVASGVRTPRVLREGPWPPEHVSSFFCFCEVPERDAKPRIAPVTFAGVWVVLPVPILLLRVLLLVPVAL